MSTERKTSVYELLTGNNPKEILSKLHIFGARAYLHKSGNEVTKMEDKAFIGIYIGYDLQSKSHKIFNPNTKKITTSINVRIKSTLTKLNSKSNQIQQKRLERKYYLQSYQKMNLHQKLKKKLFYHKKIMSSIILEIH